MRTAIRAILLVFVATVLSAQTIDLNSAKTRQVKGDILSDEQIVTDIDTGAIELAITGEVSRAVQVEAQIRASTNALFAAWFSGLFSLTQRFETAYGWGDWHSAVAAKLDASETNYWLSALSAADARFTSALATNRWTRLETQDGSLWLDATGVLWRVGQSLVVTQDTSRLVVIRGGASADNYEIHPGDVFVGSPNAWACNGWHIGFSGSVWTIRDDQGTVHLADTPVYPSGPEGRWTAWGGLYIDFTLSYGLVTNSVSVTSRMDSVAFQSDLDAIPSPDVSGLATTQALAAVIAGKELHADSFTNLIWKSVFSNGWHWLVAWTNTP